jgi:hypothetical protein
MGMGRIAAVVIALVATPSIAAAEIPDWFITGGPGVGRTSALILPGDAGSRAPTSAEPGVFEPTPAGADGRARLLMLGVGMAGTEGSIRGSAEIMTLVGRRADAISGYTAVVTYAGADFDIGFVMSGLGIGSYWGGDRRGLDRIAGTAHGELGVRLSRRVAVVIRGDLLLGSEIVNPVAVLGLQWAPGEPARRPPPPRASSLSACCAPL